MSNPLIGEIRLFAGTFAPVGWHICDGSLLNIADYPGNSLYTILGTTYGGDGVTTFALPDLRGNVSMGFQSPNFPQGSSGGETAHVLTVAELATHNHA